MSSKIILFFRIFKKILYILDGVNMENLKLIRQNSHLTQAQVAKKLNIPITTYATYEQNKSMPSREILIKISDFFGCSVDYLLGHQAKNVLYLDSYTPTKIKIIEVLKDLTEDESYQLLGYIARMKDIPLPAVLLRKKD